MIIIGVSINPILLLLLTVFNIALGNLHYFVFSTFQLMFTDVVFSAIPSSPKRDEYVGHDNDDCAHKGLTGILAELMDKVKQ